MQKVKRDRIHRATVKRSYAKLKAREGQQQHAPPHDASATDAPAEPARLALHPERQERMQHASAVRDAAPTKGHAPHRARGRSKPDPFRRETAAAQQAKDAAEEKRRAIEAGQEERKARQAQRERWRREMAKARGQDARGNRTGKPRLGRESKVLLEKVQRMMAKEKVGG